MTDDRPTRLAVATGVALAAGLAKETWDLSGHGDASWRDLTWDVVGTTTGVLIAYAIDWAIGRLRAPAAAPAAADRGGH
jgi:putative lipoprotein